MDGEKAANAVAKVLGEPVLPQMDGNTWKVRTKLIAASGIGIAICLADLKVASGSTVLGFQFVGLSDDLVRVGLVAVIAYLLIHFLWSTWDGFVEWRLRLTGTRLAFVTTAMFASEDGDYCNDPRQSTLSNWWKGRAQEMGYVLEKVTSLNDKIDRLTTELRETLATHPDWSNIAQSVGRLSGTHEEIQRLLSSVREAQKTASSERIPVSLRRFEDWHKHFLRSQSMRWLIVDALAPIALAVWALVLLARQIMA